MCDDSAWLDEMRGSHWVCEIISWVGSLACLLGTIKRHFYTPTVGWWGFWYPVWSCWYWSWYAGTVFCTHLHTYHWLCWFPRYVIFGEPWVKCEIHYLLHRCGCCLHCWDSSVGGNDGLNRSGRDLCRWKDDFDNCRKILYRWCNGLVVRMKAF